MYIAESSKYCYRVVVLDTQHTNQGKSHQCYVTAVSSTWYCCVRVLVQYELVPAKAIITFRLRIFAPWFLRVGNRNSAGLCVTTTRNDCWSFLLFFFPSSRCIVPSFLNVSAISIVSDDLNVYFQTPFRKICETVY